MNPNTTLAPADRPAAPTIDYQRPGAGHPVAPGSPILRGFLWVIYALGWAGAGVVGGMIGLGVWGGSTFRNGLGPFRDDNFWVLGAILGGLLALLIAWCIRRLRWLHLTTLVVGLLGTTVAVTGAAMFLRPQNRVGWWEVVLVLIAIAATAPFSLLLAGLAGWMLQRRRPWRRRPSGDTAGVER